MKCTWLPRSRMLTPFFVAITGIAIEVGGPLLELGEVFDARQRPLRAEQPLDVHAAQGRRIDAVAELLRPDVADQVRGAIRVAIRVAIEAGHAPTRPSPIRRSSVWLNCCCGNGVTSSRSPSSCFGLRMPLNSS